MSRAAARSEVGRGKYLHSWRLTGRWDGPRSTCSREDPTDSETSSAHRHGSQTISSSRPEARKDRWVAQCDDQAEWSERELEILRALHGLAAQPLASVLRAAE